MANTLQSAQSQQWSRLSHHSQQHRKYQVNDVIPAVVLAEKAFAIATDALESTEQHENHNQSNSLHIEPVCEHSISTAACGILHISMHCQAKYHGITWLYSKSVLNVLQTRTNTELQSSCWLYGDFAFMHSVSRPTSTDQNTLTWYVTV